jgi:hypothetical protein
LQPIKRFGKIKNKDNNLYWAQYETFEDYCNQRWGWGRNYTNKLISSAEVIGNLGTIVPILPTTESQARPLTSLTPDLQREAWTKINEKQVNHRPVFVLTISSFYPLDMVPCPFQ